MVGGAERGKPRLAGRPSGDRVAMHTLVLGVPVPANHLTLLPAYGIFHRDGSRTILRVATISPVDRSPRAWPGALALLRASGVTTVRVVIPWTRHARGPGLTCFDGADGRTADVMGVLRVAAAEGLDVWVDAGPNAGGVPDWVLKTCPNACAVDDRGRPTGQLSTCDPGFRAEAARWARAVAAAAVTATGGRVSLWTLDGRDDASGIPADHSPVTVAQFRQWLRSRYADDAALAREWLCPGLRIDDATPPMVRRWGGAGRVAWFRRAFEGGRHVAARVISQIKRGGTEHDTWPQVVTGRGSMQSRLVARDGLAPSQMADWHAFAVDAWQEYLAAMRAAVVDELPAATFVAGEVGRAGVSGVGDRGTTGHVDADRTAVPVVNVAPMAHHAAWAAASLVSRGGGDVPVMVAMVPTDRDGSPAAAAVSAVAEGAVAVELPEATYSDPDVRQLAGWLGEVEELLTASTRLDDRVAWLDDPAHAGADPDDLGFVASTGFVDRRTASAAYGAIREAGLAPVIVDALTFVADEANDLGALLVPTRRWIDLDRYGSLVVHVLRGGNVVATPNTPQRQRDGTSFRSTFLWPPAVAEGGRAQIRDGTSCVVPEVAPDDGTGMRAPWVEAIADDVVPRFRVAPALRLAVTGRLLPDGTCLAFFVNPTVHRQSGRIGLPDPSAIGLDDSFAIGIAYATTGSSAWRDDDGVHVDVLAGGALIARLRSKTHG